MSALIFTVAQRKGGAGKSTLATHLATSWARGGKRVALADTDPQASVATWANLRQAAGLENQCLSVVAMAGWRIESEIRQLAKAYDIVVIDSAPHIETEAKLAIRAAHFVLVPMQPSVMDLWATAATLALAKAENRPVMVILNRVPARSVSAGEIIAEAARLGVPIARQTIGNRVALAAAMLDGKGILESAPSSRAAAEIRQLAKEILTKAKKYAP